MDLKPGAKIKQEQLIRENTLLKKQLEEYQRKLKLSEAKLDAVHFISNTGDWSIDLSDYSVSWSESSYKLFGYRHGELSPIEIIEKHIHEEDHSNYNSYFQNVIAGADDIFPGINFRIINLHGDPRHIYSSGIYELDEKGLKKRAFGVFQDISEQIRSKQELKVSEDKFRKVLKSSPVGIVVYRSDNSIESFNEKFTELMGYTIEDVPSVDLWFNLAYPDEEYRNQIAKKWFAEIDNYNQTDRFIPVEAQVTCKDGSQKDIEFSYEAIGDILITTFVDITERKTYEKALEESEVRLRAIIENSPDSFYLSDLEGRIINVNNRACESIGFTKTELQKMTVMELDSNFPTLEDCLKLWKALDPTKSVQFESEHVRKDGSKFPVEVNTTAIFIYNQKFIIGNVRDISERKKARLALEESEQRFRNLSDLSQEGIVMHESGIITDCNLSFRKMIGSKDRDFNRTRITDLIRPDFKELVANIIQAGTYARLEVELLKDDNKSLPVEIIFRESKMPREKVSVISINNITEKKEAEKEIRRLTTAVVQSPRPIVITDTKGVIEYVNQVYSKITGYSTEELIGATHRILKSNYTSKKEYEKIWEVISNGGTWRGVFRNRRKNGDLYWEDAVISPVKDSTGSIINYIGLKEDITDRKEAENKLDHTLKELKRSNEDLEQFAYVSSHDLQEPLRKIKSYTELLNEEYGNQLDETAHKYMNTIIRGGSRMQRLIDDLLAYSRISTKGTNFELFSVGELVFEVLDSLELSIKKSDAKINIGQMPEIKADNRQIYQVFQNLISNAIKFRKEQELHISVSSTDKKTYWEFRVEDNGIGVDMKYAEKVFTIFQRLHSSSKYEGTGIGLAICKKIIERHNGQIWMESQAGKGTSVIFCLPKKMSADL